MISNSKALAAVISLNNSLVDALAKRVALHRSISMVLGTAIMVQPGNLLERIGGRISKVTFSLPWMKCSRALSNWLKVWSSNMPKVKLKTITVSHGHFMRDADEIG